ncbi:hypothetical protein AB1Y20_001348 [Prymnesium parvum]|uniref:Uncharacterized protein n=1 Tax=Prymnesium parvum TaxID=97485 RepID=A0AB34K073_PRYPA
MAMRRRKRLWREVHASNAPEELTILERNGQVEVLEDAHAQATEIAAPPTPVPAMAEPQAQLAGRDAYPFGAQCTPCVCPGWELALYALILLERASDDGVDLNQLPFPEVVSSKRTAISNTTVSTQHMSSEPSPEPPQPPQCRLAACPRRRSLAASPPPPHRHLAAASSPPRRRLAVASPPFRFLVA